MHLLNSPRTAVRCKRICTCGISARPVYVNSFVTHFVSRIIVRGTVRLFCVSMRQLSVSGLVYVFGYGCVGCFVLCGCVGRLFLCSPGVWSVDFGFVAYFGLCLAADGWLSFLVFVWFVCGFGAVICVLGWWVLLIGGFISCRVFLCLCDVGGECRVTNGGGACQVGELDRGRFGGDFNARRRYVRTFRGLH